MGIKCKNSLAISLNLNPEKGAT